MKSLKSISALCLPLFLSGTPACASYGGWVSGGGNILRNANNPWFLENTKTVTYCILSDPNTFADVPTSPAILIEKALSYWKKQMADPAAVTDGYAVHSNTPIESIATEKYVTVEVATQEFVFNPRCYGNEDLTFQLGVLNSEQREFLQDRSPIIGAAVRTSYDEVQLRGRGFIYIAPDSGKNGYKGEHLRPKGWHEGNGGLLFRAIAHELGHVFGLAHGGEGMMSESYSESLLWEKSFRRDYAESLDLSSFFHFDPSPLLTAQMLGSEAFSNGLGKKLFGPQFGFPMQVQLKENGPDSFILTGRKFRGLGGEIKFGTLDGHLELRVPGHDFGVTLFLTDDQTVFPKSINRLLRLRGPSIHSGRFVGKFLPASPGGKTFDAILIVSPDAVVFEGYLNGSYYTNIFNWSYSALGLF